MKPFRPSDPQNPPALIEFLLQHFQLKNDAALCRLMEVTPPQMSKFRNGGIPIGATFLLHAHELSGIEISKLKAVLAS